jgi:hypothetical protein
MNPVIYLLVLTFFHGLKCLAQSGFIIDQASGPDRMQGARHVIQTLTPIGQSFTPSLASISYIQLDLQDLNFGNSLGAVLYLNLRTTAITGPVCKTCRIARVVW